MTAMKQTSLFAFNDAPISTIPKWLEGYDGKHKTIFRMDAEALVEDLNRMPSQQFPNNVDYRVYHLLMLRVSLPLGTDPAFVSR